jgi:2',3'-cyclic-nucleotide 2'-phosphodiesterase (5'-nucleotidase family)
VKKIVSIVISLCLIILLCGCSGEKDCKKHKDSDNNGVCDVCYNSVFVYFDFYSVNGLHGKLADTDDNIGVDELSTYLKNARATDQNAIFVSAGDMWQGSAESNLTNGNIITDWMNELGFSAMAIGNHEYDWGGEFIADNEELAEFPLLAINVYDRKTNKLAEYCKSSVLVEGHGAEIGIIGAIGDCYSSIAVDKCDDVYFKVGAQLTELVKKESERLKKQGADFIVYLLHDGLGNSYGNSAVNVTSSQISSYYDTALSNGYVDLVFEGHTHQGYILKDTYGVYHLQNRGDNKGGISHVEVALNTATDKSEVRSAELVSTASYQNMNDDAVVNDLLQKYDSKIADANKVLGYNSSYRTGEYLQQIIADLYYETGVKEWGEKYDIALGGGFMSVRSPYNLKAGDVTYADIQSLFPFDNQLVLCSVKGRELKNKIFETNNNRYYISYGDYGESIRNNIDFNATYYIVVDTYSAYYAANRLTVVEEYKPDVFGRDLLAEYIKNGGLS